ncbi:NAD+ diphosphatase [Clostridiales Family XIII bacterium PM5-7]
MIQELVGKKLYNQYEFIQAEEGDHVLCFDGDSLFVKKLEDQQYTLPSAAEFLHEPLQYLFRINEDKYFLRMNIDGLNGYKKVNVRNLRNSSQKDLSFAAMTGYHLFQWYRDNQFCGRCGGKTDTDERERVLRCNQCGNMIYPKIAPAVIVAVTDGERILFTTYKGRAYKRYALIAGFTEIGETAEETVKREVKEEVGLTVKNVTYYKSQPWGSESNLLLGYFAELDGDDTIALDEEELSTAEWFQRDEIPMTDDGFSLTSEMMEAFKKGEK